MLVHTPCGQNGMTMKIVHVVKHSLHSNGNAHVAVDLACAQADMGHKVVFVTGPGSFDEVLLSHGVRIVRTPGRGRLGGIGRALVCLSGAVRRQGADVIHAHMMSSALISSLVSRVLRVPLITTVHNSFDRHSFLMRLGARVVAVSRAEQDLLLSRGYSPGKVVTVLNGADGSAREQIEVIEERVVRRPSLAVLSGLHARKAVDDVLAAFAMVAEEFPDWVLTVVGDGPDRTVLEEMAVRLGLRERIDFLGSSLKPRALLEQAEIYTTATLADPCPLSVAEARAAGCAVVATRVGGIPELLDGGNAGLLTTPRRPAELAQAYRTLMSAPEVLENWRARAKRGAEHLTVARMATDYIAVYRDALSEHDQPVLAKVRRHVRSPET